MIIERAAIDALSSYFEKLQTAIESHLSCHITSKLSDPKSPATNPNQPFTDHPLEKELLKINLEENHGIVPLNPGILKSIRELLSVNDIIYILFGTMIFMTYQLFLMHSRINSLKEQLEQLRIIVQNR